MTRSHTNRISNTFRQETVNARMLWITNLHKYLQTTIINVNWMPLGKNFTWTIIFRNGLHLYLLHRTLLWFYREPDLIFLCAETLNLNICVTIPTLKNVTSLWWYIRLILYTKCNTIYEMLSTAKPLHFYMKYCCP